MAHTCNPSYYRDISGRIIQLRHEQTKAHDPIQKTTKGTKGLGMWFKCSPEFNLQYHHQTNQPTSKKMEPKYGTRSFPGTEIGCGHIHTGLGGLFLLITFEQKAG
jgi:hypothetical protein